MNRAERRKNGITKNQKTYTLTADQIAKIKRDAVDEAFGMLLAVPVQVLRDKFGFGKIRLDRFLHYTLGWTENIHNGEISLADTMKLCEKETGYKIGRK